MAAANAQLKPTFDSAAPGIPMLKEFAELVRYRDLLHLMIVNIAKSRYKRSVLGVAWTLMNPLLTMAVLTVTFSNLFKSTLPNYPLYVICGLVCWNFFSATTIYAMNSLIWGGGLLKRIYIPRTIFAFAAVGHGLINFLVSLFPLVFFVVLLGQPLTSALWLVPVAVILLSLFTLGIALLVSTLAVFFTDVVELYQVMLQLLFFLAPIMYPVDILPQWVRSVMPLNPMYHLIEVFRVPIHEGRLPDGATLGVALCWSLAALLVGWVTFTRHADELAYRI